MRPVNTVALAGPVAAAWLMSSASDAVANDFKPVMDRSEFLQHVEGRTLRMGLFGINLSVRGDGSIEGRASGWDVTGEWSWQDGYFCRELDWSGTEIPYNCQLVEIAEGERVRFTVDRGQGRSAEFSIR